MNNLPISKIYFTNFCNALTFQKLLTCRSHISVVERYDVNKQHTPPLTQRKLRVERVS